MRLVVVAVAVAAVVVAVLAERGAAAAAATTTTTTAVAATTGDKISGKQLSVRTTQHQWTKVADALRCEHYPIDMVVLLDRSGSTAEHARMLRFTSELARHVRASKASQLTQLAFAERVVSEDEARAQGKTLETVDVGTTTDLFAAFERGVAELAALQRRSSSKNHPVLFWATDLWHTKGMARGTLAHASLANARVVNAAAVRRALAAQLKQWLSAARLDADVELFGAQKMASGAAWTTGTREAFDYVRTHCTNAQITTAARFDKCQRRYTRFRFEHSSQAYAARRFLSADVVDDESVCARANGEPRQARCETVKGTDGAVDYYTYTDHLILFDWNSPERTAHDILDKMCRKVASVYERIRTERQFTAAPPRTPAAPKCAELDVKKFSTLALDELSSTRADLVDDALAGRCTGDVFSLSASDLAAHWSKASAEDFITRALGGHFLDEMKCGPRVGALKMGWSLAAAGLCTDAWHDAVCARSTGTLFHSYPECASRNDAPNARYRITASGAPSTGAKSGIASWWGYEPLRAVLVEHWRRAPAALQPLYIYLTRDGTNKALPEMILHKTAERLLPGAPPARAEHWSVLGDEKQLYSALAGRQGILIGDDCGEFFDPSAGSSASVGLWLNNGVVHALPVEIHTCHRFWFFPLRCESSSSTVRRSEQSAATGVVVASGKVVATTKSTEIVSVADKAMTTTTATTATTTATIDRFAAQVVKTNAYVTRCVSTHFKAQLLERVVPLVARGKFCDARALLAEHVTVAAADVEDAAVRDELLGYLKHHCFSSMSTKSERRRRRFFFEQQLDDDDDDDASALDDEQSEQSSLLALF